MDLQAGLHSIILVDEENRNVAEYLPESTTTTAKQQNQYQDVIGPRSQQGGYGSNKQERNQGGFSSIDRDHNKGGFGSSDQDRNSDVYRSRGQDHTQGSFGEKDQDCNQSGFRSRDQDRNKGGFASRDQDRNQDVYRSRGQDHTQGSFGAKDQDRKQSGFRSRDGDRTQSGFRSRDQDPNKGSFGSIDQDRTQSGFSSRDRDHNKGGFGSSDQDRNPNVYRSRGQDHTQGSFGAKDQDCNQSGFRSRDQDRNKGGFASRDQDRNQDRYGSRGQHCKSDFSSRGQDRGEGGIRSGGQNRNDGSFGGRDVQRQSNQQQDRSGNNSQKVSSSAGSSASYNAKENWESEDATPKLTPKNTVNYLEKYSEPTIPDQSTDCYVSNVKNINCIYITVDNLKTLDDLTVALQNFYNGSKSVEYAMTEAKVGQPCCALYSEDESWYRARVTHVGKASITVLFVDFGNSETTELSKLRLLNMEFGELPYSSVRCRLQGAPMHSSVEKDSLEELVMDQELDVKFVTKFEPCEIVVKNAYEKDLMDLLEVERVDTPFRLPGVDTYEKLMLPDDIPSCYVSIVSDVNNIFIYIQNMTDFEGLTAALQELYKGPQSDLYVMESAVIGQPCCAILSEDENWYRAVVTEVNESNITVLFVDFGNSETTELSQLRLLSQDLPNPPRGVVKCKLHGAPTKEVSQENLESILMDKELNVKFVTKLEPCIVKLTNSEGNNMVELLSLHNDDSSGALPVIEQYKQATIPDEIKCFATVAYSVDNVHIQIANITELGDLSDALQIFYGNNEKSKLYAMTETKVGQPCCALYSEDQCWYRAQVTEVNDSKVTVLFIDFGNSEITELTHLRLLSTELKDLPCSTVKCRLIGATDNDNITQSTIESVLVGEELNVKFLSKEQPYDITVTYPDGTNVLRILQVDGAPEDELVDDTVLEQCQIAFLTHTENVTKFYLQLNENTEKIDELAGLLESKAAELLEGERCSKGSLSVGDVCCAQFTEDNVWYRARVISVSEESDDIEVFFMDYGNSEITKIERLRPISDDLNIEDAFAVECGLDGVQISPETTKQFEELLAEQELHVLFMEDSHIVKVYFEKRDVMIKLVAKEQSRSIIVTSEIESNEDENDVLLAKCKTAFLTHIENVHKFYLQLDEHTMKIDKLAGVLESKAAELLEADSCSKGSLSVGDVCCAQFTEDDVWYRARVTSVSGDSDDIEVFFMDYGNSEITKIERLRPITDDLNTENVFAIECSLDGVTVTEETSANFKLMTDHSLRVAFDNEIKPTCNLVILFKNGENVALKLCASTLNDVSSVEFMKFKPVPSPELDRSFNVVLSHIESIDEIYLQQPEQIDSLETQVTSLNEFYSSGKQETIDIRVDQICCARYSIDESWYRAKVISAHGGNVKVHFVDFGNYETNRAEHIRTLDNQFLNSVPYALRCTMDLQSATTSEHTDRLWELLELYPTMKAKYVRFDETTEVATVELFTEDDRSISDMLFDGEPNTVELESPQSPDSQCSTDATLDESQSGEH